MTGAARGIGLAIAQRFADEGARVVLVDRLDEAAAAAAAIGPAASAIQADVTQDAEARAAAEQTVSTHGRLDVLVRNAGQPWSSTSLTATDED